MSHEDAGVVVDLLECDAVTEECHFVASGVVVEPEVIEAVTRCLPPVGGVTDIKHNCRFLTEELFEDGSHHIKNLWVVGSMFMLGVIDEKVVGTIIHEDSVLVETDGVVYLLVGHEAESEVAQLCQLIGRSLVERIGRKRHRTNLVEVCTLFCVLAHAIFRGHLSFAGKPRHTAQGCHSV